MCGILVAPDRDTAAGVMPQLYGRSATQARRETSPIPLVHHIARSKSNWVTHPQCARWRGKCMKDERDALRGAVTGVCAPLRFESPACLPLPPYCILWADLWGLNELRWNGTRRCTTTTACPASWIAVRVLCKRFTPGPLDAERPSDHSRSPGCSGRVMAQSTAQDSPALDVASLGTSGRNSDHLSTNQHSETGWCYCLERR